MNAFLFLICLFLTSIAYAEESELYLLLGEIKEVTITPSEPPSKQEIGKGLLDGACANELIKFDVSEYISGDGKKRVTLDRSLDPFKDCSSSWRGVISGSESIAILSHSGKFTSFHEIANLRQIEGELGILEDIGRFLAAVNSHGMVDLKRLLQPLKEPITTYWDENNGNDELNALQELGILYFTKPQVDQNKCPGCTAVVQPNLVTFKMFIPLSKIRAYGF